MSMSWPWIISFRRRVVEIPVEFQTKTLSEAERVLLSAGKKYLAHGNKTLTEMSPLRFDLSSSWMGTHLASDKQLTTRPPSLSLKWTVPRQQSHFSFFLRLPHGNEAGSDPRPQRLGPGLGDHPQRSSASDQRGDHVTPCGRCPWARAGAGLELGLTVQVLLNTDL